MLVEYHRNLLGDKERNEAFYKALQRVIVPGKSIVADVGSGTGMLGFMASKLGAKEVYLYEQGEIIGLSQKLAKDNKIKNIQFMYGNSTTMPDPPPVDVIVSETLGNYALEEYIIATIEDAKRFLKPGGAIMPCRIEQFACPVISDRFFKELSVWDDVGFGLDFTAAKTMSLNNIYVRTFGAGDLLGEGQAAQRWDSVDFTQANDTARQGTVNWTLDSDVTIYGLAVWWSCTLLPGIELSTGPLSPKTHWEQLYFPVLEPLAVQKSDILEVNISSTSSAEEGTILYWEYDLRSQKRKSRKQALDLTKGYIG
jgi:type I protein arginine methyltransferase